MRGWLRGLLAGMVVVVGTGGVAKACNCGGRGPCGVYKPRDVMFFGKVLKIDVIERPLPSPQTFQVKRRQVHITVEENFAGQQRVGEEVVVETGIGNGDCGYPFRAGERYLVDAYHHEGLLETGTCSETKDEKNAIPQLRQLRTEAARGQVPDVIGLLTNLAADAYPDASNEKTLRGVGVTLTSLQSDQVVRAITDANGVYTMPRVAPGRYELRADLPATLVMQVRDEGKPPIVEIPDAHGESAACRFDIRALPTGTISGQVVDSAGIPVWGTVTEKCRGTGGGTATMRSGPEGTFVIDHLAPGEYTLVLAREGNWRNLWYYPGVQDESEAQTIHVGDGEKVKDVRMVVK